MSGTQTNPWEQNNPWTEVTRLKAESARLETELALAKEAARKVQAYNEEIIENVRAQLVEARERIKELTRELHKTTRRAERSEHHWSETERRLAAAEERAKAGRLHVMQTNKHLREELKAARQVADVVTGIIILRHAGLSIFAREEDAITRMRAGDIIRRAADQLDLELTQATYAYREQTNNQQPQGDKTMPTAPYTEIDAEMSKHLARQTTEEKSQTDLEAEMKRRLDELLDPQSGMAPGQRIATRMASDDSGIRSQDAASCAQVGQEGPSKLDPAPLPTPATEPGQGRPEWPITPETAPAGARILVKRRGSRYEDLVEITIREWAPSGKRVLFYDRCGRQFWDEDLPTRGILVETLPPSPERLLARSLARRMMEDLIGNGAERPTPSLDALLKDKPGAATTLDRLDELAAKQEGDAER